MLIENSAHLKPKCWKMGSERAEGMYISTTEILPFPFFSADEGFKRVSSSSKKLDKVSGGV